MKYGSLMQNNMPISVVEVKTERRISIWRTFVFPNRKYLYLSRALVYTDQIRFPGRPSEDSDVTKVKLRAAILKIDIAS